ncbi:DUF5677 domain-containing protein [Streptomyces sp. NPDC001982]|uniref:DUF5677 domain-containing protein n=1 Tax=Streptomyces sp. NPDC001982 TaxID=3154405 RepID=UPI00332AA324
MAYKFGPNKQCIKRVRAITPTLIQAAADTAANGVEIPVEHAEVFPTMLGWWRFTNRTAEGMLLLLDNGFTVEAMPMMRNLIGHAYAMNWLLDNGTAGMRALRAYTENAQKSLADDVNNSWKLAEPLKVDVTAVVFADEADEKLHNKLVGELKVFPNLLIAYGNPAMYPVYRHHSTYAHTTAQTASAYLSEQDGRLGYHSTAQHETDSDVVWVPVALIQAAKAISPLIKGDPMRKVVEHAIRDLGIPDDVFTFQRVAKKGRVPASPR